MAQRRRATTLKRSVEQRWWFEVHDFSDSYFSAQAALKDEVGKLHKQLERAGDVAQVLYQ